VPALQKGSVRLLRQRAPLSGRQEEPRHRSENDSRRLIHGAFDSSLVLAFGDLSVALVKCFEAHTDAGAFASVSKKQRRDNDQGVAAKRLEFAGGIIYGPLRASWETG
jgi:hypothetical protein